MASIMQNTSKGYKCVQCGSEAVNVIREDPAGVNPRLKCTTCNFMFDASAAEAAEKAGEIPTSSPETLAAAVEPETTVAEPGSSMQEARKRWGVPAKVPIQASTKLPRTLSYVFVSKDRTKSEFCNSKEVKKVALRWEQEGPYEVFELTPKQFDVQLKIT